MEVYLPESMHNLHPWHHGQFCHLSSDKCDWGKNSLVSTEQVILFTLWLKSFSAELTFWWAMTWGTNIFTIFAIKRGLSTHLFPRILCQQIFSHVASKSDHPAETLATAHKMVFNHTSAISPFRQSKPFEFLSTCRRSLYHCPSGKSEKVAILLRLFTFVSCLHIMQNHL